MHNKPWLRNSIDCISPNNYSTVINIGLQHLRQFIAGKWQTVENWAQIPQILILCEVYLQEREKLGDWKRGADQQHCEFFVEDQ